MEAAREEGRETGSFEGPRTCYNGAANVSKTCGRSREQNSMRDRGKIAIVSFSTVLALLLVIGVLLGQEKGSEEPYRPLAVLSEVLARIESDYVENPNFSKVTEGALHGLLESLDPFSSYLTPEEYKAYLERRAEKASIGAVASKRFGFVGLVAVLPNSPAQKAGLEPGDVFESIDGRTTREMSLAEVNSRLEGPAGSTVKLAVVRERAAEPKLFELRREVVPIPDVEGRLLEAHIGYLRVAALPPGETPKIAARLQELRRNGAAKFILDLRNNAFGEMDEGIGTANLFLRNGLITYLEGQQYPRQSFLADPAKAVADEPLVVLVNNSTGGAAEIVAAAIQETHRGEVVGERTYGIGSVQKVIPLDDGSALLLSVAKYHTPAGKEIQATGIRPDVVVEEAQEPVPLPEPGEAVPQTEKPREDAPLKRAIELLSAKESLPQAA